MNVVVAFIKAKLKATSWKTRTLCTDDDHECIVTVKSLSIGCIMSYTHYVQIASVSASSCCTSSLAPGDSTYYRYYIILPKETVSSIEAIKMVASYIEFKKKR